MGNLIKRILDGEQKTELTNTVDSPYTDARISWAALDVPLPFVASLFFPIRFAFACTRPSRYCVDAEGNVSTFHSELFLVFIVSI